MNTASLPDVDRYNAASPKKLGLAMETRAGHACKLDFASGELTEGFHKLSSSPDSTYSAVGRTSVWGGVKDVGTTRPDLGSGP